MLFHEMLLAAAGIDNEAERQRQILASSKEGNRLRLAVVEDLKVVSCEIRDESTAGVANSERYIDQANADTDLR